MCRDRRARAIRGARLGTLARVTVAPLDQLVAPDWAVALAPVEPQLRAAGQFLRDEVAAGRGYLPAGDAVLRAFHRPLADVRVLVVGQDPYPTPGHPMGLSFSVQPDVRPLPRSLTNIFTELVADVGRRTAAQRGPVPLGGPGGDAAEPGADGPPGRAGVAPSPGVGGGDRPGDRGPRRARRTAGRRAVGPGRAVAQAGPRAVPTVESVHPSPLSASRGFFGSRPFSRVNELLVAQGAQPVDWSLT